MPPSPPPPKPPKSPPNPRPARSPSTTVSLVGDRALALARMEDHPGFDSEFLARSSFAAIIFVANRSSSDRASRAALRANPKPVFPLGSSSARSSIGRSQRRSRLVRRLRYRTRPEPARRQEFALTRPDPETASDRSGWPAPIVPARRLASRVSASSSVSSSDEDSGDRVATVESLTDRVATRLVARPTPPPRLRDDRHALREDRAARSIEGHDRTGPGSRLIFADDKNPRAHRRVDGATSEAASDALADEDVPRPEVARHSARRIVDTTTAPGCAPQARGLAARPVDVDGVPAPARRAIARGDACIVREPVIRRPV